MRFILVLSLSMFAVSTTAQAQRPPGNQPDERSESVDSFVARLLAFDKDKDGKLSKAEVNDPRLERLFDLADADHNGSLTKDELQALASKEQPPATERGRGGPGFGPPQGGPGGPIIGLPHPGEILPAPLRQRLDLSEEQVKQIDALQNDVDERLAKILTDAQKQTLRQTAQPFGRPGRGGLEGGPGEPQRPRGPGAEGGRPPGRPQPNPSSAPNY
jgi:hypothetical protein